MKVNELLSVLDKTITNVIFIYYENNAKFKIYDVGVELDLKQAVKEFGEYEIENMYPTKMGDMIPSIAIEVKGEVEE